MTGEGQPLSDKDAVERIAQQSLNVSAEAATMIFNQRILRRLAAAAGVFFLASPLLAAEAIQFPNEELASESVLPVFDQPVSVKNQNVVTKRRFEIGPLGGYSLMEPFYNPMSVGLSASYHFDEVSAVNLMGSYFFQGLSNNGSNLNPVPGTTNYVNLQYAPAPKYLVLVDYQYTGFYGKISIAKDFIMNLSLYGLAGAGMIGVGDAYNPAINVGIGQKFYFTPNFALRFDFRFLAYQGPDVLSKNLSGASSQVAAAQFSQTTNYISLLSFGAVFLLPGM